MMSEPDFTETDVVQAGKRLGIRRPHWMGDWFNSWSPRNDNSNAEGTWHHWCNLSAYILSHPATKIVAPELHRELPFDPALYSGGNVLTEQQIADLFPKAQP